MQKLLFWGPVLTASGYGEHARQLLKSILTYAPNFDVSVCSVKWGATPMIAEDGAFERRVRELLEKYEAEKKSGTKYDVSVQVTIPNEFQKLARVNIGVTAGIEVDRVSPEWILKANSTVDLVVVPSKHSANTFAQVVYRNNEGEEIRLQKPVLVSPEGFDGSSFHSNRSESDGKEFELEADFNFLSVGLGLDKGLGEDRKNIGNLVKWFCETFPGDRRVGLVLKVGLVNNSYLDFEACKSRIQAIKHSIGCGEYPRIQLIHGRLTKNQMASLYRHPKVKAYVTLTHGEGYGLPILEAAACGLPVLATNWSGHLDFLQLPDGKKRFVPIDYVLGPIPQSAVWPGVMEQGTNWAMPSEQDFKSKLKKIFLSHEKPLEWAGELAQHLSNEYDESRLGMLFVATLQKFLADFDPAGTVESMDPSTLRQKVREQLGVPEGKKTLLYTMPMSAGDVFISNAVVNSLKKKFPEHSVYFATDQKYIDLVQGNPNIERVVQFTNWMMDVPACEKIFDEVYTPNLAVQMNTSNWIHGGKGRLLGHELAAQCGVEFGDYYVPVVENPIKDVPEIADGKRFIAFHPGSGKGQHEARNYRHWKKVIHNLRKLVPDATIVTLGQEGDIHFEGCVDLRGRTTYGQMIDVIRRATCLVGIDSVAMHIAAATGTPHVNIFGSSYATSTGPVLPSGFPKGKSILIDSPNRMGCEKACYKYQCTVDRDSPCLNEIDPRSVVAAVVSIVDNDLKSSVFERFEDVSPKIAGYTHIFNPEEQGFPYLESIRSMMGFCDEVIVVDGGSTDGSIEKIKQLGEKVKVYERKWDWNEPGMDGMQKAYGRAMCSVGPEDFLWQQDADEVVHEDDYSKIKKLAERFPADVDLIHLPVVELWGCSDRVRTDRHSWKWRMSRNNFRVTHGINKDARVFDEKTGKTYAKKGMSDGCEYVDIMTGEYLPHKGFYTRELELVRNQNPESYGKTMNKIFSDLPSVFHYSWADLPRKIRNFKSFWDKCWSNLYNDPAPVDRFPDVQTDSDVLKKAQELSSRGGEHGSAKTFVLERSNPALMKDWLERIGNDRGPIHDDQGQTAAPVSDAGVPPSINTQGTVQADAGR